MSDLTTRVVMLGTGTPIPDPTRHGPSLAVVVGDRSYIVDAGPGVVRRAIEAAERHEIEALQAPNIRRAFLTHLHHDHCAGVPDLIYTPWTVGRSDPIEIAGPPGTADLVARIEDAYSEDRRIRLGGLEPASPDGWRCQAYDMNAGPGGHAVYEDDRVRIIAFEVNHGDWEHSFGYRFESDDRNIVISGDTTYCEALIEQAQGCDLLIHEVYCAAGLARRSEAWQTYHRAHHTSAEDLGRIATQAAPAQLALTHVLLQGGTWAELQAELASTYDGPVTIPDDLDLL
jgi:ribonuclease Z